MVASYIYIKVYGFLCSPSSPRCRTFPFRPCFERCFGVLEALRDALKRAISVPFL